MPDILEMEIWKYVHIVSVHEKKKPVKCIICDASFEG